MESLARTVKIVVLGALCASAAPALAADEDISRAVRICEACHGQDGLSTLPSTPIIAGIDAGIIADDIYARQAGEYPCPGTPMCAIVRNVSSPQAEALGKYFASKPFVPADQKFDPDKAARGAAIHAAQCEQCHSKSGSDPADQASILSGQWLPYLRSVLADYAADKRPALEPMRKRLTSMSEDDLDALANYYASAPGRSKPTGD